MNETESISPAQAAALLLALLPELARAETYPQWSDGTGETVRRQRVTLYDAAGGIVGADQCEHRSVLRVLQRVEPADWDRPQSFDVAAGTLALRSVPCRGCGEAHEGDPDRCRYCTGCGVDHDPADCGYRPSLGALLEQRHQLEDPAEPPLAVSDDYVTSLAVGLMTPVVWGARPVSLRRRSRPATDTPAGGAL